MARKRLNGGSKLDRSVNQDWWSHLSAGSYSALQYFSNGNTFLFLAHKMSYPSVHSHAFHTKTGSKEREDENCDPSSPGIISSVCFIIYRVKTFLYVFHNTGNIKFDNGE